MHMPFVRPIDCLFVLLTAVASVTAWAAGSVINVPVTQVGNQSVGQGLELEGKLEAVKQSTVSALASGRVVQLAVKAGDKVHAGQVLAVVDDRMTVAGVSQAQAQVAQADANLANTRLQTERTRELHAKGFVSRSALDQADAQLKAALAAAQGAQAGQVQSQVAQGHTRLEAPYDGWVLATHVQPGDLAMPGTPVVTVYAPQPIRAVAHVPASRIVQVRQAQKVEVGLSDGQWVQPVVRTAVPAADPVSQTVEWRLDLPAAATAGVMPGQPVQVRFASGQAERLTVPAQAVFRRGELTAVYAVSGPAGQEQFVLRAVRLGAANGGSKGDPGYEVLAGLRSGEKVALDPVRAGLAGARPAP